MKRQIRYVRANFVRGLSSMLDISTTHPRGLQRRDPMQALRGDMVKIGQDMHRVVDRERGREETFREKTTAAE